MTSFFLIIFFWHVTLENDPPQNASISIIKINYNRPPLNIWSWKNSKILGLVFHEKINYDFLKVTKTFFSQQKIKKREGHSCVAICSLVLKYVPLDVEKKKMT